MGMHSIRNISSILVLLGTFGCASRSAEPPSAEAAGVRPAPDPAAGTTVVPDARSAITTDGASRWGPRSIPIPGSYYAALQLGTRSPSGAPGARYWQQRVNYRIEAELEPATNTISGIATIVYHNRSPVVLRSVVLNLYQNIFSQGVPRNRSVPITGGMTLHRVSADGLTLMRMTTREISVVAEPVGAEPGYAIEGTLGRLVLPRPLSSGDSVTLRIEWQHRVPPAPAFRTGWEDALGGRVFQVAQWYPQVATFDDIHGWDATPYLGDGEFHLELGDFEVALTVPEGYLVGATGELQNAAEVLGEQALGRLRAAMEADSVIAVVTEPEMLAGSATRTAATGRHTWRFRAGDVRDFAFATSNRYVWDGTHALVDDGAGGAKRVAVHALYRPGAPHWTEAARFGQHATAFVSRELIPYLYSQITIVEGPVGGMEYPQVAFIGKPARPQALYSVIAHEIAHQWFPMMVGSNEAAYAWYDEGIATFYENLARHDIYPEGDPFESDRYSYLAVAGTEREVPLMRHTDLITPHGARPVAAYMKPAVLLRSLRGILGAESFDHALRIHAREWLLKRATPWDFFHTMERVSGRDLDWFFQPWWFETGFFDQAIGRVEGAAAGDLSVTVVDLGDHVMPTWIAATTSRGETVRAEIPVERWLEGHRSITVVLTAPGPVVRVEIDPDSLLPDVDPANNVWTASGGS